MNFGKAFIFFLLSLPIHSSLISAAAHQTKEVAEPTLIVPSAAAIAANRETLMPYFNSLFPDGVRQIICSYLRYDTISKIPSMLKQLAFDKRRNILYGLRPDEATNLLKIVGWDLNNGTSIEFADLKFMKRPRATFSALRSWATQERLITLHATEKGHVLSCHDLALPGHTPAIFQIKMPRGTQPKYSKAVGAGQEIALAWNNELRLFSTTHVGRNRKLTNPSKGPFTSMHHIKGTHLAVLRYPHTTHGNPHYVHVYDVRTQTRKPAGSFPIHCPSEFHCTQPKILPCKASGTLYVAHTDGNIHRYGLDGSKLESYHTYASAPMWNFSLMSKGTGFITYKYDQLELRQFNARRPQLLSADHFGLTHIYDVSSLAHSQFLITGQDKRHQDRGSDSALNDSRSVIWTPHNNSHMPLSKRAKRSLGHFIVANGFIKRCQKKGVYHGVVWHDKSPFELACIPEAAPGKKASLDHPLTKSPQDSKRAAESVSATPCAPSRSTHRGRALAAARAPRFKGISK